MDTAILSSFDKYTTFSFGNTKLTFRTCNNLERYTKVILWDNGYIEVMAKYRHLDHEIEEYIDLEPVLEALYMDKKKFLAPIKEVKIEYVWFRINKDFEIIETNMDEIEQNIVKELAKKNIEFLEEENA